MATMLMTMRQLHLILPYISQSSLNWLLNLSRLSKHRRKKRTERSRKKRSTSDATNYHHRYSSASEYQARYAINKQRRARLVDLAFPGRDAAHSCATRYSGHCAWHQHVEQSLLPG